MTSERRTATLLSLAVAAGFTYLVVRSDGPLAVRVVLVPIPVLCLAGWAWSSARTRGSGLIVLGLLLSAAGDVLLELKHLFLAGLAVFLLAHLSYTAAFLLHTRALRPWRFVPFLAWGALALSLLVPVLGALVVPVSVYVLVICVMMWRAAALQGGPDGRVPHASWALVGAVLFGASDTLHAMYRFVARWPDVPYIMMVLYWAGQAALARSARLSAGIPERFGYHHADPPAA